MKSSTAPTKNKGYRALRSQTSFLWYTFAGLLTRLGDSVDALVYSWMVYDITGSATWLTLVAGFNALPTMLLMPVVGVWVEQMNKKAVLIFCDIGRGALVLVTAFLYTSGMLSPWMVAGITFMNSTLEAFRTPAGMSVLPQILDKDLFDYGSGFRGTLGRLMELVGVGLAPLLVAIFGIIGALLVDAALFIASGFVLFNIQLGQEKNLNTIEKESFFKSFRGSFSYFKQRKIVLALCIMGGVLNAMAGPLGSTQTAYIQEELNMGAETLSVTGISILLAMAIGTWIYPFLRKRIKARTLLIGGLISYVVSYSGLWFVARYATTTVEKYFGLCTSLALLGFGSSILSMVANVSFMEQVESSYLARIGGIFNAIAMSGMPIMAFLIAPVVSKVSLSSFYVIMGGVIMVLTVAVATLPVFFDLDKPLVTEGSELQSEK